MPVLLDVNVISLVFPPPGAAVQDQAPVPTEGVLPPNAALVVPLHTERFPPFVEVVGAAATVNVNVDCEDEHGELLIVHAKV